MTNLNSNFFTNLDVLVYISLYNYWKCSDIKKSKKKGCVTLITISYK